MYISDDIDDAPPASPPQSPPPPTQETISTSPSDTPKEYHLSDYVGIRLDPNGRLCHSFTCPRPDTLCDGFTLTCVSDCLEHELDWHAGPYTCLICGQTFAAATALRRHAHYEDSETKRHALQRADAIKKTVGTPAGDGSTSSVRVYHGNGTARSRATRLGRLLKREEFENERKRKQETRAAAAVAGRGRRGGGAAKSKADSTRDSFVVGSVKEEMEDGFGAAALLAVNDEEERDTRGCKEPCCPYFERHFPNLAGYTRHLASHAHEASVRMGEALLAQLEDILQLQNNNIFATTAATATTATTATAITTTNRRNSNGNHKPQNGISFTNHVEMSSQSSTDVEMSDYMAELEIPERVRTPSPPPSRPLDLHTQLLSPPPTPCGDAPQQQQQLRQRSWIREEALPMAIAARLAETRLVLRELRCNAPGCWMYGQKMASSQGYWNHLASVSHVTALKDLTGSGREVVYVPV